MLCLLESDATHFSSLEPNLSNSLFWNYAKHVFSWACSLTQTAEEFRKEKCYCLLGASKILRFNCHSRCFSNAPAHLIAFFYKKSKNNGFRWMSIFVIRIEDVDELMEGRACPKQLVSSLSQRRNGFNSQSARVGFVVERVAKVAPCSFIHPSPTLCNLSNWERF
jgi:hypothetical protein